MYTDWKPFEKKGSRVTLNCIFFWEKMLPEKHHLAKLFSKHLEMTYNCKI